ncbi:drug/metabolite transporter, DME family [Terribacillus halophilus]|uniref:Drug/metabolite transporter, DME family n=1 Tax=Terribacillus halophilus TaxID=361279 RepID=A0A1G6KUS1_9BACI|nr:EamA family transporter [Terribacillus halophilus]SDC34829.1 drug/metabolite transporter, DME family [Terribacillus halophilus]
MIIKKAPVFVLLAAMLWGTTGAAQAFAPAGAHPIAIGAARLMVGGMFLLLVVLFFGRFERKGWPIRLTILAALSMACYQPLFFSAVLQTGVAVGTVIAIGSAPIMSGLLELLFFKRRPARIWWMATVLSIIGCVLLFLTGDSVTIKPAGILLALGAGLSFAGYTLLSGKIVQGRGSLEAVAVIFGIGGILLFPFLFLFEMDWILQPKGFAISLHLGIIATAAAYFLFSKGLQQVPASSAVTLSLAEPLTAAVLGVVLVGEELTLLSWLGIGLLLAGIVLTALVSGRREPV